VRLAPVPLALYIGPLMDDVRLKKLKYRAEHRGFREADIIIGGFAEKHLHELSEAQLDEFERLIDVNDPDLYAWIVGRQPIPEEFCGEVMDLIRSFRFFAHTTIGADRGA
jgi:antitoxin CptB